MSDLPAGLHEFIAKAGWGDAAIEPIPGDASFRRYFRLCRPGTTPDSAMLMHAPPPHEDPAPFLKVAHWLNDNGMRAPHIHAEDASQGWVLTEDFGDDRMREWIDARPEDEEAAYEEAIEALIDLHRLPPGPFPAYDMATYLREARLLVEWYAPAMGLDIDAEGYEAAWREVLAPVIARQQPGVTVLRDYHAENIMLLGPPGSGAGQGLIDFQDALVGHPAYDLVSLLQDARRDVDQGFADGLRAHYQHRTGSFTEHFIADFATLGAQRNAKIVGIFTRLFKRDGKDRYLAMIPRVWNLLEADLRYSALKPVADWFAANIPEDLRRNGGGTIT
ncbi:aminoglycoside phosphotransferase family protein [Qipengyuania nanhaisediminis]|uniref:aminoglycoside phosphotransferase family protein n=1 Tax=Qipengyuania nanhaisediminis TaxID=604088 RepID=UPI0038B37528